MAGMLRATIAVILALLICPAAAQSRPQPVPAASGLRFRSERQVSFTTPQPTPHTGFEQLAIFGTLAWAADVATTQIGLAQGGSELNSLFGRHPSPARLWITASSVQGIFLYACHKESREHPHGRFWRVAAKISIGVHGGAAVNNLLALHFRAR
jgi:hypothetical protein